MFRMMAMNAMMYKHETVVIGMIGNHQSNSRSPVLYKRPSGEPVVRSLIFSKSVNQQLHNCNICYII